jgi:hypothetical protein
VLCIDRSAQLVQRKQYSLEYRRTIATHALLFGYGDLIHVIGPATKDFDLLNPCKAFIVKYIAWLRKDGTRVSQGMLINRRRHIISRVKRCFTKVLPD